MSKKEDGGPAYPVLDYLTPDRVAHMCRGMTLHDYFAAKAPIGFDVVLRVWGDPDVNLHDDVTRKAFFGVWAMLRGEYADAMLAERNQ